MIHTKLYTQEWEVPIFVYAAVIGAEPPAGLVVA